MSSSVHQFISALERYYGELTPSSLEQLHLFYDDQAFFKDPFNEVRGLDLIKKIFDHMFETLVNPRFVVTHRLFDNEQAFMCWTFVFATKSNPTNTYKVAGSSHLTLMQSPNGAFLIKAHRDYWDPAQEIYEKIPLLSFVFRWLRKQLSATN
jgi:steroid delta-isomerase